MSGKKLRAGAGRRRTQKKSSEFSKKLVSDIRVLLWVVTVGGLLLAAYCIHKGFTGSLPWLSAMVGLPWSAHGVVCSFYLNMAKSDHSANGITFETAKANGFTLPVEDDDDPTVQSI
jgi:hypothetical protein